MMPCATSMLRSEVKASRDTMLSSPETIFKVYRQHAYVEWLDCKSQEGLSCYKAIQLCLVICATWIAARNE